MRYYLINGVRYPEYESDLFSQRFLRFHRILSASLLSLLLCIYILLICKTSDFSAALLGTVVFLLLIAAAAHGIDKTRMELQVTFRFHRGFVQNVTYRDGFSVDAKAPHYISHITLHYRTRGGDVIRPCYVFSEKPISKLLGDRTGDSIHEFNRQSMALLPQTEELTAWVQERYQLDTVPEFPGSHYAASVPCQTAEIEDM